MLTGAEVAPVLFEAGGFPFEAYLLSRRQRAEPCQLDAEVLAPAPAGSLEGVEHASPIFIASFAESRSQHGRNLTGLSEPASQVPQLGKLRAFAASLGADLGERRVAASSGPVAFTSVPRCPRSCWCACGAAPVRRSTRRHWCHSWVPNQPTAVSAQSRTYEPPA